MYKNVSALEYISIFGALREDQLVKLKAKDIIVKNEITYTNSINKLKFDMKLNGFKYNEDLEMYFAPSENDISNEMSLAIDTFIELKNNLEIDFFKRSTDKVYPSLIFFTQVKEIDGEKVYKRYDIIYCSVGAESLIQRLVYDNDLFENLLIIVDSNRVDEYREINLENNIRYVSVTKDKGVVLATSIKELEGKIKNSDI